MKVATGVARRFERATSRTGTGKPQGARQCSILLLAVTASVAYLIRTTPRAKERSHVEDHVCQSSREEAVILYRINATVGWLINHDPEDELWIAVCPSLNLNADGTTREELDSCMAEAVHLLFTDLHESGEFHEFLQEQGWTASSEVGGSLEGGPEFRVPFEFTEKNDWKDLATAHA